MKQPFMLLVTALLFIGISDQGRQLDPGSLNWQVKVDPWVQEQALQGDAEFLVMLEEQADLVGAELLPSKHAKGQFVYQQLTRTAERSQKQLLAFLVSNGIEHRSFWIANMVWVRAGVETMQQLASRSDVKRLVANPAVRQVPPLSSPVNGAQQAAGIEWNLVKVRASEVWSAGFTGQGVVVAGQDTGYQWSHPALKNSYRGWDGVQANHNYSWHDAIHPPYNGGICGTNSLFPCDDHGHGTHTMGTIVGDDGLGNQIGMAPGARWIGCRNMDRGIGTPATYAECYQWFLAPTDLNGDNPRPDLAPDIINNSWSCPTSEGCTDPNVLLNVVENVRLAGIMTVHAASNLGSSCSTVNSPAAIYDASFSIGATDSNDNIASFSSRGPVAVDGSYRMKPDVSAPGVSVRSSIPTTMGTYGYLSGTSMASPHVAGLAALMISHQPDLQGQVDQIERLITRNTVPRTTAQNCGGRPGSQVPNNTYGWGRIDSWRAVTNYDIQLVTSRTFLGPGELIDYTFTITQRYLTSTKNILLVDHLPENTTFISASSSYIQNGSTITWTIPLMHPFDSHTAHLSVLAPSSGMWTINNWNYFVVSDLAGSPSQVDPVKVYIAENFKYFPYLPRP